MFQIKINTCRGTVLNKDAPKPFSMMFYNAEDPIEVDWGDGTVSLISTETKNKYLPVNSYGYTAAEHSYTENGEYVITVPTDFENIKIGDVRHIFATEKSILTSEYDCRVLLEDVVVWDVPSLISMHRSFAGCQNLQFVPKNLPENVVSARGMFENCHRLSSNISEWDVSCVNSMASMFRDCHSFDEDLSGWDVRNVDDMSDMFRNAIAFNGDVSNWDVRNVEDFSGMFFNATSFDRDLSKWEINLLSNTKDMFNPGSDSYRDTYKKYYTIPANVKGVKEWHTV